MNGLIFDDATCELVMPPVPRARDYINVADLPPPTPRITTERIKRAVCDHYGLRSSDMTSRDKPNSIARPRQLAMYLSRKLTPRSYPEIGQSFGGRDHSTVIHAYRSIKARLEDNYDLRADHDSIVQALKG